MITKTLCYLFNSNKKGYVTIEDIIRCISNILLIITYSYGTFMIFHVQEIIEHESGIVNFIIFAIIVISCIANCLIIAIIILCVLSKISKLWNKIKYTKIIKCKLKQDGDK